MWITDIMPGTCLQFAFKKTKPSWFMPPVPYHQRIFPLKWPRMFSILLHAKRPDRGERHHTEFFYCVGGSWLKDQKRIIKDHYLEDPLPKGIFLQ